MKGGGCLVVVAQCMNITLHYWAVLVFSLAFGLQIGAQNGTVSGRIAFSSINNVDLCIVYS